MCLHEEKYCPRCTNLFECRVGNIINCQCYTVKLTEAEREFIANRYPDCLCASCMVQLKNQYNQLQQELQLQVFFKGR